LFQPFDIESVGREGSTLTGKFNLSNLSDQEIATLIEDNIIEYELALSERIPGAVSRSDPQLTWMTTGIPLDMYNGVFRSDFGDHDVDAQIEKVLAGFQVRNLPMIWHVGPSSSPSNLSHLLKTHGLQHIEDEPGMAVDLHTMNEAFDTPCPLEISCVHIDSDLRDWVNVWAFDSSSRVKFDLLEVHRQFGIDGRCPWRYFIGSVNGKPVATSLLFLGEKAAAVHWVVTLPEWRQQGIGVAMTLHALREARHEGYHTAVLTASPQGNGVYRRIGFREYCTIRRYGWEPVNLSESL
jgi:ribosomal protein S18 acetylase RimI-like enzyme